MQKLGTKTSKLVLKQWVLVYAELPMCCLFYKFYPTFPPRRSYQHRCLMQVRLKEIDWLKVLIRWGSPRLLARGLSKLGLPDHPPGTGNYLLPDVLTPWTKVTWRETRCRLQLHQPCQLEPLLLLPSGARSGGGQPRAAAVLPQVC